MLNFKPWEIKLDYISSIETWLVQVKIILVKAYLIEDKQNYLEICDQSTG